MDTRCLFLLIFFTLQIYFGNTEVLSAEINIGSTEAPPKATVEVVSPLQPPFYPGDVVTLRCAIAEYTDWLRYDWYRNNEYQSMNNQSISIRFPEEAVQYECAGVRRNYPEHSSRSAPTDIKYDDEKPTPTISSETDATLFTGNSVTLKCDMGQSTGWRFYWYRGTQNSDPVALTDGDSYSISSVKVSDGGQYWCRAGRGDPVFYTQYSDDVLVKITESPKTVAALLSNWTDFFHDERINFRCDIQGDQYRDWKYSWYNNGTVVSNRLYTRQTGQKFTICYAEESDSGEYSCRGTRSSDPQTSEISASVRITVSAKPKPVLRGPPQTWLTEGDSVTLSCEVRGSTTGWRFHWYKTAPYRPELTQISHENGGYLELVSDSSRGAGGSYTLNPVALRHIGVYVCRAERGEPAYHTEFSKPQPLWVTGFSPPSSLVVHPNTNQHFDWKYLSLSCVGSVNLTGWRLRWFSGKSEYEMCPTGWDTEAGSTCKRDGAFPLDSGVYWCQSESGEQSNPVNITVHNGDVILESPARPVTEGDPLTLRCRYRYQPSNIADFYKDGTLLQTSTTGEMTIPAVSKSHEGLYKCRNPEKGESPESWIIINVSAGSVPHSGSSLLVTVGVVVGLVLMIVLIVILVLLYRFKKLKGVIQTPPPGQQQLNTSQNQDLSQSAGNEGDQLGYEPLHSDAASAGLNDVTYATIDLQTSSDKVKKKRKKDGGKPEPDIVYSKLKAVKATGEDDTEDNDLTYVQVTGKKKGVTTKVKEFQVDAVYSEVKHPASSGV